MNIKAITIVSLLFFLSYTVLGQKQGFVFDNQSDNVEVNTISPAKVNIVCSNENIYKIRIVPDQGIGKVHLRIIAPKSNTVLYDNAKDGYKLEKILNMQNSLVIMLEVTLVETDEDMDNDDFISHGWVAMLIQNKLK